MEFKVGDYVEAKPECYRRYGLTTRYWIGKVIRVTSGDEFSAKTFRLSYDNSYSLIEGAGATFTDLSCRYFRKVSEFKFKLIRNIGNLK